MNSFGYILLDTSDVMWPLPYWTNDIDSGKIIGSVFLDLRKAFD